LEFLESRCVLSCDAFVGDGTLFVTGDEDTDNLEVREDGPRGVTVACDGRTLVENAIVDRVEINSLGGPDTINYRRIGNPETPPGNHPVRERVIDSGDGDDTIDVHSVGSNETITIGRARTESEIPQEFPSVQPRTKIDYVFFRPADGWRVVEQQVVDEPVASDHRPLPVVLECVPSWLAFVPEMERMDDLDSSLRDHRWSQVDATKHAADLSRVQADWKTRAPIVQALLTPERVRSLSKWAVKQMEPYATVQPLEKAQLQPVATDEKQGIIVLESTVDTLPTHNPLVTRWLKAFVRYDIQSHAIVQITITIRGKKLE
jgi:hypothetical protein